MNTDWVTLEHKWDFSMPYIQKNIDTGKIRNISSNEDIELFDSKVHFLVIENERYNIAYSFISWCILFLI